VQTYHIRDLMRVAFLVAALPSVATSSSLPSATTCPRDAPQAGQACSHTAGVECEYNRICCRSTGVCTYSTSAICDRNAWLLREAMIYCPGDAPPVSPSPAPYNCFSREYPYTADKARWCCENEQRACENVPPASPPLRAQACASDIDCARGDTCCTWNAETSSDDQQGICASFCAFNTDTRPPVVCSTDRDCANEQTARKCCNWDATLGQITTGTCGEMCLANNPTLGRGKPPASPSRVPYNCFSREYPYTADKARWCCENEQRACDQPNPNLDPEPGTGSSASVCPAVPPRSGAECSIPPSRECEYTLYCCEATGVCMNTTRASCDDRSRTWMVAIVDPRPCVEFVVCSTDRDCANERVARTCCNWDATLGRVTTGTCGEMCPESNPDRGSDPVDCPTFALVGKECQLSAEQHSSGLACRCEYQWSPDCTNPLSTELTCETHPSLPLTGVSARTAQLEQGVLG